MFCSRQLKKPPTPDTPFAFFDDIPRFRNSGNVIHTRRGIKKHRKSRSSCVKQYECLAVNHSPMKDIILSKPSLRTLLSLRIFAACQNFRRSHRGGTEGAE